MQNKTQPIERPGVAMRGIVNGFGLGLVCWAIVIALVHWIRS